MNNQSNILAQLAQLKKWHEEHCADEESGNSTVFLPSADQAKLYQILGLSPSFIHEIETSQTQENNQHEDSNTDVVLNNSVSLKIDVSPVAISDPVDHLKINNNLSERDKPRPVTKRPFLKRGEGLTNRFKIPPDQYNLKKLPKYKFSTSSANNAKNKRASASATPDNEPADTVIDEKTQSQETPFKYAERTRKSCLKTESLVHLEDLRARMTQLCTNAIKDDSDEFVDPQVNVDNPDDHAKRMLDFSRKSPRVTFHSEVTKIPFENYFQVPIHHEKATNKEDQSGDSETDEDCAEFVGESLHCEFNIDAAFQKHAIISTPVDGFKEKHQLLNTEIETVDKSPRTVLVEKGSLLREKLKELEQETQSFREQNRQLQKTKQMIELQKVQLAEQRTEMERSFKEQLRQLELEYTAKRREFEENLAKIEKRSLVPNKKHKEEIKQMQEKIDELEKELKNREIKHGAAQTRLRCHIRALEKENKEHVLNFETLKKENKRLEAENARLQRQKNNRMLLEINKNLTKLGNNPESPNEGSETRKSSPNARNTKKPPGKQLAETTAVPKKSPPAAASIPSAYELSSDSEDDDDSHSEMDAVAQVAPSTYFPHRDSGTQKKPFKGLGQEEEKENKELSDQQISNTTISSKREIVNKDGSTDIYYPNGNLKKISADGMKIKMMFFNKDIKESDINEGTVKYYYAETRTWHTSYLDGLEVLEFPSGQTEHRYKDGKIEIHFPNGTIRVTNPKDKDILEEWRYPDGSIVVETKSKEKIIKLPNGQKEIHTADHKRREYPDGTVKIVYNDGRTETRYSNGRIRIKDKNGQLISDSQNTV